MIGKIKKALLTSAMLAMLGYVASDLSSSLSNPSLTSSNAKSTSLIFAGPGW